MENQPIHSPEILESKESKKLFFEEMKKARDTCFSIYNRMMTDNMSVKKARQLLDETFINSGLFKKINSSDLPMEFKTRIGQVLKDPYLMLTLAHTYNLATDSIENLFVGALANLERDTLDLEIQDAQDCSRISEIFARIKRITHNDVLNIYYKNYFFAYPPGNRGKMISKINNTWEQLTLSSDGNLEILEDERFIDFDRSDINQIALHNESLVSNIETTIFEIKVFLADRKENLPSKIVEILEDLLQELNEMISKSLDETKPDIADYVGSDFQGRFTYTGIAEKEFKYRVLLSGILRSF